MRTAALRAKTRFIVPTMIFSFALLGLINTNAIGDGPLPEFTGYTRVGFPPAEGKVDPKVSPVAADREGKSLGATVYYMVLDRQANNARSNESDRFGTGITEFDSSFVAGKGSTRDRLDTDARYLYLYQVVNDSGREAAVKSVSVRLIIDPKYITSWGYFAEKKETDKGNAVGRGLGFVGTAPFDVDAKKQDNTIRPVSTDHPSVSDTRYRSPAPALKALRPYGFAQIPLGQRAIAVAAGEDVGRPPETTLIVENADFGPDDNPYVRTLPQVGEERLIGEDLGFNFEGRRRDREFGVREYSRNRNAAFRALWNEEEPLRKRERSTIFGFTSDYPPTMESVALGSRGLGITPAAGKDDKGMGVVPAAKDKGPAEKKPGVEGIKPVEGQPEKGPVPSPVVTPAVGETGKTATPGSGVAPAAGGSGAAPAPGGAAPAPGGITPAAGLGAIAAAGAGLPIAIGTVPTPIPPIRRAATTSTAAAPMEALGSGTLGSAIGGGLGGNPGGGGGGFVPGVPGSPFMAGRGAGGGGGGFNGGGGLGGGEGVLGDEGGQREDQGQDQGQDQNQGGTVINNNIRVIVKQNQSQNQKQKQKQNQGGGPDGNVVPAPPAWLLGLLGLPAFYLAARRKRRENSGLENADTSSPHDSAAN